MPRQLEGLKVVVPESREIELLCSLLEAEGAVAIRCPLVRILEAENFVEIDGWTDRLLAGRLDDLVLFTGEGLRHLAARADQRALKPAFVTALGRMRTIIRGPKPARALRELGLTPSISAAPPTSQGLLDALAAEDLTNRRVGVQLYPGGGESFIKAIEAKGAAVATVTPYRYASQAETSTVVRLIEEMAEGAVDMIVFTSSPQVARLAAVAREVGLEAQLAQGLKRVRVAAVGPVVEDALKPFGLEHVISPRGSFHLKPLVRAIVASMDKR